MKWNEMKTLSNEQLEDKIADWKNELYKAKVSASMQKKVEKTHVFPQLRRQIARAYTLIKQKQMQESSS